MRETLESALRESQTIRFTLRESKSVPGVMYRLDIFYYFLEESPEKPIGIKGGAIYFVLKREWPAKYGRTFVVKLKPVFAESQFAEHRELFIGFMLSVCDKIEVVEAC